MKHQRRSLTLADVKTMRCSCGHLATGETNGELLAAFEAHIDAKHASHGKRTHSAWSAMRDAAGRARLGVGNTGETVSVEGEEQQ